ncbi:hypothetical protein FOA52_010916 [Chlamydomonas sp. UWO 241]|nr:hypothetical protein FOA52_010916 [Chlamydomonas sp. UWO 241]
MATRGIVLLALLSAAATPSVHAVTAAIPSSPPSPPPSPPGSNPLATRNILLSNIDTWGYGAPHEVVGTTKGFSLWMDLPALDYINANGTLTPSGIELRNNTRQLLAVAFWVAHTFDNTPGPPRGTVDQTQVGVELCDLGVEELEDGSQLLQELGTSGALVYLHNDDMNARQFLLSPEIRGVRAFVAVVCTRGAAPTRRADDQAFLTVSPGTTAADTDDDALPGDGVRAPATSNDLGLLLSPSAVSALNAAAARLETALGRRLHPMTVAVADFSPHVAPGGRRPYAVYDASSGELLLDKSVWRRGGSGSWGGGSAAGGVGGGKFGVNVGGSTGDSVGGSGRGARAAEEGGEWAGDEVGSSVRGSFGGSVRGSGRGGVSVEGAREAEKGREEAVGEGEGPGQRAGGSGMGGDSVRGGRKAEEGGEKDVNEGEEPGQRASVVAGAAGRHLFGGLERAVREGGAHVASGGGGAEAALQLLAVAAAAAVPAAFAAAPPLWFCLLCPAVLGLLAPLVINAGLMEVANALCVRMQLPDDQCFDVMLGALGVGFFLSLGAAIPIFFVCRLMDCAHRNTTAAVGAAAGVLLAALVA